MRNLLSVALAPIKYIDRYLLSVDRYLLLNYPGVWATKIHYILPYGLFLNYIFAVFLIAFISPLMTAVEQTDNFSAQGIYVTTIVIVCFVEGVILINWIRRQLFFNVEREYGYISEKGRWVEFLIQWVSAITITLGVLITINVLNRGYIHGDGEIIGISVFWVAIVNSVAWITFIGKRLKGIEIIYSFIYGFVMTFVLPFVILLVAVEVTPGDEAGVSMATTILSNFIFVMFCFRKISQVKKLSCFKRINAMSMIAFPISFLFLVFMSLVLLRWLFLYNWFPSSFTESKMFRLDLQLCGIIASFLPWVFFQYIDRSLIHLVSLPKS